MLGIPAAIPICAPSHTTSDALGTPVLWDSNQGQCSLAHAQLLHCLLAPGLLRECSRSRFTKLLFAGCFLQPVRSCAGVGETRRRQPRGACFSLTIWAAVEECTQKGCLALSLLELLGFNLTFVFLASIPVLIEVSWSREAGGGSLLGPQAGGRGLAASCPDCLEVNLAVEYGSLQKGKGTDPPVFTESSVEISRTRRVCLTSGCLSQHPLRNLMRR